MVVVVYREGAKDGFIITAFLTRRISNSKSKIRYGGTEASSSPSSMKRNRLS